MGVRDSHNATQPEPLLFADGTRRDVAALAAQLAGRVPTLTPAILESLRVALSPLAARTAERTAGAVTKFVHAAAAIFPDSDSSLPETLLALTAFDGLLTPAVRRLGLGDTSPASLIVAYPEASGATGPFLRACARPSTRGSAALFCSGARFPLTSALSRTFSRLPVRLTLASLGPDGSVVLDQNAQASLVSLGALEIKRGLAEFSATMTLPLLTPERLDSLREPALTLARGVLAAAGAPAALAAALATAGLRAVPDSPPPASLAAAIGVFQHELAEGWHASGALPVPAAYRLRSGESAAGGRLIG
jgi:hypothetical protein